MKIGIITWFRYENYGTKLQAIALYSYLKEKGHEVKLIDFRVPRPKKIPLPLHTRIYKKINYTVLQQAQKKYKRQLAARSDLFDKVIQTMCDVTEIADTDLKYIDICNQFDLIICGSDQIWNPNWYHPYYYADFPEIKAKKVSYAPSMGIQTIPEEKKEPIQNSLKSFACVTVREEKAASMLEPLLGYHPQKVLDPTMLLSGKCWKDLFRLTVQNGQKYVLCYFLSDNRNHWKASMKFALRKGLAVKIIPQEGFSFFQRGNKYPDAGVKEFLELILNAEYILTDSCHGTVFSILLEKEFYLFERFKDDKYYSQNDRVRELIQQFGLQDHMLQYNSHKIVEKVPIDFTKVNLELNHLRARSEQILKDEIEE